MARDRTPDAFDPELRLADLSRQTLCHLGREYLLAGHLQDRVGLPLVAQRFGGDAYRQFAIDEWMGASPIYSRRMQRALGFEGHDVATVFKNLQLDIGAPPQFMDFQFRLDGPESGEFWLPHCGALLDVEPFGEARVRVMCHDIEDPTFDATAAATHPRMRMRPIHRPPRQPADHVPHCRWRVFLDDEATDTAPHPNQALLAATRLAGLDLGPLDEMGVGEPGGWPDYAGPFDPGFQLEDLGHAPLVRVCEEVGVQIHLLARAFMLCVAQREGPEAAELLGRRQWIGAAALAAHRVREALGLGRGIADAARLFQLHPHFQPRRYVDLRVRLAGDGRARIALFDCPALDDDATPSWLAGLGEAPHPALDAIAHAANARARCLPAHEPGARLAWDLVLEADAEPRDDPAELALARISRGAAFRFEPRRPLRR